MHKTAKPAKPAFWLAAALLAAAPLAQAEDVAITGAGSTFAAPLYVAVGEKQGKPRHFQLAYEAVGSSEGMRRVMDKRVDFGASDRPLPRKDLNERGFIQLPTAIGGVVVTANLPGVAIANLKLDAALIGDLFMGRVTRWNDPRIGVLNPALALPGLPVTPIYRDEGSGTSWLFTSYLARTHPGWKESIGATSTLKLQGGTPAKGNGGVVKEVLAKPGSIAYLEFGYAQDNKFPSVQLKNAFGTVVAAGPDSIAASVKAADWELLFMDTSPTFELDTVNVGCPQCWPIVGLTYVIAPRRFAEQAKVGAFQRFVEALLDDDALAREENYVPLPSRAKNLVRVTMRAQMGVAPSPVKPRSETPSAKGAQALASAR